MSGRLRLLWAAPLLLATLAVPGVSACVHPDEFQFSVDRITVWEYQGSFNVTITRFGNAVDCTDTVRVFMLPHDSRTPATSGVDYEPQVFDLQFQPRAREVTFPVRLIDDDLEEPDEWFTLQLDHRDPGALASNDELDVRIRSDEGGFRFARATDAVPFGDAIYRAALERFGENHTATNITIAYLQKGTEGGPDNSGRVKVQFPAGSREANATIPVMRGAYEDTIVARLVDPLPVDRTFIGTPGTLRLLLAADPASADPEGAVVQYGAAVYRVNETDGGVRIDIVRTGNMSRAFDVSYFAEPGTATAADFTPRNGTVSFTAGQATKSFVVRITEDDLVEGPETLWLRLGNTTAMLGPHAIATVIIVDSNTVETEPVSEGSPSPALWLVLVALLAVALRRRM